jgi:S-adenosylmethionine/arginine decarboxylase-like enzyme
LGNYWGYHLVLDCGKCDISAITDADNVTHFAKELVKRIDMVAYGEPQVVNFGSGNKAGFTLVQLIETSNICAHFCNDTGDMYLDVFSCKPYNKEMVIETVKEYFKPETVRETYLTRQA